MCTLNDARLQSIAHIITMNENNAAAEVCTFISRIFHLQKFGSAEKSAVNLSAEIQPKKLG